MYTIYYSKKLNNLPPVKFKLIDLAISFAINFLKIDNNINFKVYLFDKNDKTVPEGITLASYNPSTKDIYVRADNRILMDIVRSLFHELEHMREDSQEGIDWGKFDDIYSDTEYNANKQAGIMCKVFVKENNAKWLNKMN